MVLRSFVKINLLFRIMDPLKRKSPIYLAKSTVKYWLKSAAGR